MLFESLLAMLASGLVILFVIIPAIKLTRQLFPKRTNPVKEARIRLEQAKLDAEAARINRETERLYEDLYQETLEQTEQDNSTRKNNAQQ